MYRILYIPTGDYIRTRKYGVGGTRSVLSPSADKDLSAGIFETLYLSVANEQLSLIIDHYSEKNYLISEFEIVMVPHL